jgi:hypothetical protein
LIALAVYCLWHGIKALRTGVVHSPTMLSPGTTKASEAPLSYWTQVLFWLGASGVLGFDALKWLYLTIET